MEISQQKIFGLDVHDIDSDIKPLSAYVFLKYEEDDGYVGWLTKNAGEDINDKELIGLLSGYLEFLKDASASKFEWEPTPEDI